MKRNEELIVGEKIVAVPFFFERYSISSVFELLKQYPKPEISYQETNGFGEFSLRPKWLVCNIRSREKFEFITFVHEYFEEEDCETQ